MIQGFSTSSGEFSTGHSSFFNLHGHIYSHILEILHGHISDMSCGERSEPPLNGIPKDPPLLKLRQGGVARSTQANIPSS